MTPTSRNSIKVLLVTFISVCWNKSKGEWIKEWMFSAPRSKTAQRVCVSFCWPTLLQRRIWRDADVCASPQMLQDVESKVFFARCVDMHWHVLCFISFTSSSASSFTHTSPCRNMTFIRSSSGKPSRTLLFHLSMRFWLPRWNISPQIPWICFALPSARRAHRKHLVRCNLIYEKKKKKNWKMTNKPFVFFCLLSSVLSFRSKIPSSSDLHLYSMWYTLCFIHLA